MKNILHILLIVLLATFYSCKKQEVLLPASEENITLKGGIVETEDEDDNEEDEGIVETEDEDDNEEDETSIDPEGGEEEGNDPFGRGR